MTKKDYILIAEAIKTYTDEERDNKADSNHAYYVLKNLANNLANKLYEDNARFDRDKFLKACGVPSLCYCDEAGLSVPHYSDDH